LTEQGFFPETGNLGLDWGKRISYYTKKSLLELDSVNYVIIDNLWVEIVALIM